MKFASLLFLISSLAFAQAADPLKDDMKKIGDLFQQIQFTITDPAQNQANAQLAAQMVQLFTDAKEQVPSTITSMPQNQQASELTKYQGFIQQEIDAATALSNDFLHNDNQAAQNDFIKMNQVKKLGHPEFKPPSP